MNRKHVPVGSLLAVLLVAVAPRLQGQATPAPTPAPEAPEETVVLSPFVVEASEDEGSYRATQTLAASRIRTDLRDVGSAISVITPQFLQDTASNRAEDLLLYTPNTEVEGQRGNFLGGGDGAVVDTSRRFNPVSNTRVRGLNEADNTRNFYLSDIPWDSYNVGRVDLQRGPNSILFGIGKPSGIVNSSLDQAGFADSYYLENQIGSYGSTRWVAKLNKELIDDELAVRVALVRDDTNFRQEPAFRNDERVYGALRWDPKFLSRGDSATQIRINYETGKIKSNYPRNTPPLDAITPWFLTGSFTTGDGLTVQNFNKRTFSGQSVGSSRTRDWYVLDSNGVPTTTPNGIGGANNRSSPNYNPYLGAPGSRVWDGVVLTFDDGVQGMGYVAQARKWPLTNGSDPGAPLLSNTLQGIQIYSSFANAARLPNYGIGPYKAKSLTDRTIFDYMDNLLDGPNKGEFNDFHAFNAAVSQTFFNNKLGFELAYDAQTAKWGNFGFLSNDAAVITIDVMNTLIDGTPNPNVGRPFTIGGGGSSGTYWQQRDRDVVRATIFGEYDFREKDMGTLGKILGKHSFTALYSRQENENQTYNSSRFFLPADFTPHRDQAVGQATRDVIIYNYLGGSLADRVSAAHANLSRVNNFVNPAPTQVRVFNNTYTGPRDSSGAPLPGDAGTTNGQGNIANFVGWQNFPLTVANPMEQDESNRLYTNANHTLDVVDSKAAVWQGYLLDQNLVGMFGFRTDEDTFKSAGAAPRFGGLADVRRADWRLPANATDLNASYGSGVRALNVAEGDTVTWSVVGHLPKTWADKIGVGVSVFYNESENFQPDAGRIDLRGTPLPAPTGDTKDYGVTISAFEDKLTFKINWYETTVNDVTLGGSIGNAYLIGAGEAWGQQAAWHLQQNTGNWPADQNWGVPTGAPAGRVLRWQPEVTDADGNDTGIGPAADPNDLTGPPGIWSQAQIDAQYARQEASVADWFANQLPADFVQTWGMNGYATGSGQWSQAPNIAVTGDTVSEGVEFELMGNPVRGLNVAFNASQAKATRLNLAQSYVDWIEARWADYQGPMGDMRIWGGGAGGETVRSKYRNETMAGYGLWRALEGADVPELREWRYNLVANYSFLSDGTFKGVNVGGSYRWQDKIAIGFPVIAGATGPVFDVEDPFYGPSESSFDAWIGYQRKISEKYTWRVQLNIRNVFADDKLIPVTVQPDGSAGTFRIPEPQTWTLTNSISF